jgi:hypothetical protein
VQEQVRGGRRGLAASRRNHQLDDTGSVARRGVIASFLDAAASTPGLKLIAEAVAVEEPRRRAGSRRLALRDSAVAPAPQPRASRRRARVAISRHDRCSGTRRGCRDPEAQRAGLGRPGCPRPWGRRSTSSWIFGPFCRTDARVACFLPRHRISAMAGGHPELASATALARVGERRLCRRSRRSHRPCPSPRSRGSDLVPVLGDAAGAARLALVLGGRPGPELEGRAESPSFHC